MAQEERITQGSCLCRQIRYEITGNSIVNIMCHCNNCRKITGSLCMANSLYSKSQLRILSGEAVLKTFEDGGTDSGNVLKRSFCSNCGSPIYTTRVVGGVEEGHIIMTSGTMDFKGGDEWAPMVELYCKNRCSWLPNLEGTKTFETGM
ncbi:hypothetical protein N7528_006113 [Penicillium herquei]|nr:hypothetical protein N7528_006113 [Penicillium herquei]